jgi:chorismate dehydratase
LVWHADSADQNALFGGHLRGLTQTFPVLLRKLYLGQPSRFGSSMTRIRIGAVSYLNTKPLIATLAEKLPPGSQLSLELPSALADQLGAGQIDIGLIPAIEFFRGPSGETGKHSAISESNSDENYRIISNACIACRGKVRSVRLFFRVPPPSVRSMAIDVGSRTSVALASILLLQRFNIRPRLIPLPIDADPQSTVSDAVLVIGDRAMHPENFSGFVEDWDLGEEWFRETGLPFVFAMWVGRERVATLEIASKLEAARDEGIKMVDKLSQAYAPTYGLSREDCVEYLSRNLCFIMQNEEWLGLRRFHQLSSEMGLVPNNALFSSSKSALLPLAVS